jgi:prepilin peptidase CpaA
MIATTASTAFWFLPFVIPIAVWVAWSDMKFMKIPNKAVLALLLVFAVVGLVALPFDVWAWRWTHFAVILAAGFVLSTLGLLGAGDAKFAAAMAPFFAVDDLRFILALYAAASLGAFLSHRMLRTVGPVRSITPDWQSWTRKDFPMGLALSGMLVLYLVAAVLYSPAG